MNSRYRKLYDFNSSIVTSKIIYDDGLVIIQGLDGAQSIVAEVSFPDILVIRVADEGSRIRLQQDLNGEVALMWVDEKSELIPWLSEENLGTRKLGSALHYLILIGEEVIDVVSLSSPNVAVG